MAAYRGVGRSIAYVDGDAARRSSTSTRSASMMASSTSWVTSSTAGPVARAQFAQQRVHPEPGQRVERAERLVGEQQRRFS